MRFIAIVLVLAVCGCYRATHLVREITIERDADGKVTKTIERELVTQEIDAEGIKAELLKGIKVPENPPVTDQERDNPNSP